MLTAAKIRAAAPAARPYKLADGAGLHLYVAPTGRRTWRMAFRFGSKEQLLTFGSFPEVSLARARELRDDARGQLRANVNPAGRRRRAREAANDPAQAPTFEATARTWHAQQLGRWSPTHAGDVLASLEQHIFPAIGGRPLAVIEAPEILRALRAVEAAGSIETARRIQQRISAVFDLAIAEGATKANPAQVLGRALLPSPTPRRQAALVDLADVRAAYAAIAATPGSALIRLACQLLALTGVRCGSLREARWVEFEGVARDDRGQISETAPVVWRIPAARMKLTRARKADSAHDHLVPLSRQAVELVAAIARISGDGEMLFADRRRLIGINAIGDHHQRAGLRGRHSPHGWRAAFSTILNELEPTSAASIDLSLGHNPRGKVEGAYNRAQLLGERRRLLQIWGDLLSGEAERETGDEG